MCDVLHRIACHVICKKSAIRKHAATPLSFRLNCLLITCDGQVADIVNRMIFAVLCAGPDKVGVALGTTYSGSPPLPSSPSSPLSLEVSPSNTVRG